MKVMCRVDNPHPKAFYVRHHVSMNAHQGMQMHYTYIIALNKLADSVIIHCNIPKLGARIRSTVNQCRSKRVCKRKDIYTAQPPLVFDPALFTSEKGISANKSYNLISPCLLQHQITSILHTSPLSYGWQPDGIMKNCHFHSPLILSILAGTPPIMELAGKTPRTTAPAATMQPSPITAPSRIVAFAPIQQPFPILIPL